MERSCTLYVGKIPEGVDDALMTALLECCGKVIKWKRSSDPASGKPKGFGFADYQFSHELLRAMRLLPTIAKLGDVPLLLKVDAKVGVVGWKTAGALIAAWRPDALMVA